MTFKQLTEAEKKKVENIKKTHGAQVAKSFRAHLARGVKPNMAKQKALAKFGVKKEEPKEDKIVEDGDVEDVGE